MKKKETDYYFMFQTSGVPLLFTDICARFYLPYDGVIFEHKNQYKQFIHNSHAVETRKKYAELYKDADSIERFCKEFKDAKDSFITLGEKLRSADFISVDDFDKAIDYAAKVQAAYAKLDPIYTDLLFDDPERDTEPLKALVLEKKNLLREDANKVFFIDESPFIILEKKISEQSGVPFKDISYLSIENLRRVVAGESFADLYKGNIDYAIIREDDIYTYFYGDEATAFVNEFTESAQKSTKELKGISVSKKGVYRGKVRKVEVDYNDFEGSLKRINYSGEGYILVADATIPELVPLMKKARAIVTNVGGLLSHAAITSRELGLPCVVGTKTAAEIFKEGDLIEVDADKGIVKFLE